jgi:hypothetical protein
MKIGSNSDCSHLYPYFFKTLSPPSILANDGTLEEKPFPTPHIHIAHATQYSLASSPTSTHDGAIRNLHTFIVKKHNTCEAASTRHKFPYVDKWLSNTQINQKLSNYLWKDESVTDAQLTQTLKFRYAQYMGRGECYHMSGEQWAISGEQWAISGEQWAISSEQ